MIKYNEKEHEDLKKKVKDGDIVEVMYSTEAGSISKMDGCQKGTEFVSLNYRKSSFKSIITFLH